MIPFPDHGEQTADRSGRSGDVSSRVRGVFREGCERAVFDSLTIVRENPVATASLASTQARTERGPTESSERYHAMDALRAAMLLLGIVLHAGLSYSHMPRSDLWPFKDSRASGLCDLVIMASGLFRMPIFFMIAGFFAARIHRKRGIAGLLRNRARRILVPFVMGWLIMFPLVRGGFLVAAALERGDPAPVTAVARDLHVASLYADPYPIHLWFLEYLLIYYAVAAATSSLLARSRGTAARKLSNQFRSLMNARRGVVGLACLTALPLFRAPLGVIPTPLSFVPDPIALAAHGVFFAFGWILFENVDLLPELARGAGVRLTLGMACVPVCGLLLKARCLVMPPDWLGPLPPGAFSALAGGARYGAGLPAHWSHALGCTAQVALALLSSLSIWQFVLGITGAFLRALDRPIGPVRSLADASYWLYLAHFPLTVWLPIVLAPLEAPALLKLVLVLAITMSLMLLSYEILVRPLKRRLVSFPLPLM
jgi:glucan biosynthesis protein C